MIFVELYPALVYSLEAIASDSSSANEVADKADGFKFRIRTMEFVSNLKILENVLGHTHRVSVALQSKEVDIAACTQVITSAKTSLQQLLKHSEREFSKIFSGIAKLLEEHNIPLQARASRHGVTDTEAVEKHLRETKYEPLLSRTIEELDERFGPTFDHALNFFALIPFHMVTASAGIYILCCLK